MKPALPHERLASELVRALRGRRSQLAFSRRLGHRTNVVYTWEAGRRWPTAVGFLQAARTVGIDVRGAVERFYGPDAPPTWLDHHDPASEAGVAALIDDLRGQESLVALAERCGRSRFAVGRWASGEAQPRLPDMLRVIDAASLRLLDFVAAFVDPAGLPSAAGPWRALLARRDGVRALPQIPLVLRALELEDYRHGPVREAGWIARRVGISPEDEARCLEVLAAAGQIRRVGGRWAARSMTVDTRAPDPAGTLRLKAYFAALGQQALSRGDEGLYSFNVMTVARSDLPRLRELHVAYFNAVRALVAASAGPGDEIAVLNLQLFTVRPPL